MSSDKNKLETTPLTAGMIADPHDEGSGPAWKTVGALSLMVFIAVLKTQLTAFLFSSTPYPTAYSGWSCVVTCIMLVPVFIIKPETWALPTRPMAGVMTLIIFFTALDLGGTNIALARLSTALQQCIAATNPFITICLESILYSRLQHVVTYASVFMVVVGSILTSLGQISIDTLGLIFAIVAVCASASKYTFTHKAFRAFKGEMGAMALLFWVDLLMIPIFLVWTLINGEIFTFFSATFASPGIFFQMTATAALGGVRALTQFLVLVFVSATSMSTANVFTQILNILIAALFTQSSTTTFSPELVIGISLVILFSILYAAIKANKGILDAFDQTLGLKKAEPVKLGEAATVGGGASDDGSTTRSGWMQFLSPAPAPPKEDLKVPLSAA